MTQRYKVEEGSNSCHCCFEYTVVDTTKPTGYEPKPFETVAECFNEDDAKLVCEGLNLLEASRKPS